MSNTAEDPLKRFVGSLGLRLHHYVSWSIGVLCVAGFLALGALYGDEAPWPLVLAFWLSGMAGLAPFTVKYLTVAGRLPKDDSLRKSVVLSQGSWIQALVPPPEMRRERPWIAPLMGISVALFWVSMIAVLVRLGVADR